MNYRKFILIVALFLFSSSYVSAQMLKAYVVAGLNAAQIDGDEVFGYSKYSPQAGVGMIVPFNMRKPNEGWQASLELLYSQRGAKETLDPFKYNTSLHYVDIPIMAHYVDIKGGWTFGLGAQYGVTLPFSRKHESEADYMGLIFMTMAGYNPNTAVTFWQKMSASGGASIPEFMSTHPSDATRISDIQKYLPELQKYKK